MKKYSRVKLAIQARRSRLVASTYSFECMRICCLYILRYESDNHILLLKFRKKNRKTYFLPRQQQKRLFLPKRIIQKSINISRGSRLIQQSFCHSTARWRTHDVRNIRSPHSIHHSGMLSLSHYRTSSIHPSPSFIY